MNFIIFLTSFLCFTSKCIPPTRFEMSAVVSGKTCKICADIKQEISLMSCQRISYKIHLYQHVSHIISALPKITNSTVHARSSHKFDTFLTKFQLFYQNISHIISAHPKFLNSVLTAHSSQNSAHFLQKKLHIFKQVPTKI